ncbi:hypothetical protein ACWDRB_55140 [Nonomuraea sp. NPDC003707]
MDEYQPIDLAGPQLDDGREWPYCRAVVSDPQPGPALHLRVREVCAAEVLRNITTMPRTPGMYAICERGIGALCCELLNRILILGKNAAWPW